MGRCNNRRAQERAAEARNIPSRARFSKGPPSKKGGRGGRGRGRGRGGDNNGRGGRGRGGRTNDAVVQKIQDRVQQKRKDVGGISIVKSKRNTNSNSSDSNIASISRKRKHALDGIDVSRLDKITLSAESVAIVERLLRTYNVWEGGKDDVGVADEKKFDVDDGDVDRNRKYDNDAKIRSVEEDNDRLNASAEKTQPTSSSKHSFGTGDDTYDEYTGDYDDEPDYPCRNDGINFNDVDRQVDCDDISEDDSSSMDEDDGELNMNDDEEVLINSPIFRHLTQHFSFRQQEVILALRASNKRLRVAKQKAEAEEGHVNDTKEYNETTKEDEGALLEMSMDWLSLHLKESDLRRGFHVQKITKPRLQSFSASEATFPIKAVPHASLSVMPKFTPSQYEKETKEALIQLKRQNLTTDLIRCGFHSKEVEKVFPSMKIEQLLVEADSVEDDGETQPLILNGKLLTQLVDCVEFDSHDNHNDESSALDQDVAQEMDETTILERDQEKEVLEAIYAEGFQLLRNSSNESDDLHYQIEVNPTTPLKHPACNDKCHLHVITRRGYPLTSSPVLWFTNMTLPPTLLRRISIKLKNKASELVGQAAVFNLMEYLSENAATWQAEFMQEEAMAEKISEDDVAATESDDDEIDYYTVYFTVEELKKLSRRQRQKYKAAQKSHARDAKLLEKQTLREQKNEERRARTRIENETISSRMAEKAVKKRWKEWVEEEAEKSARKAMNDAFLRGEDRGQARDAAEKARLDILRFHGELEDEDKNDNDQNEMKSPLADSKTDENKSPPDDRAAIAQMANEEDSELNRPTVKPESESTPKTILFVEKLRRMYEEKAKEKAAGIREDANNKLGGLHLTTASTDTDADKDASSVLTHVPAPIVTPSPGVEDVLKDVLVTQREQPWLIQPDARVPTTDENSSAYVGVDDARKLELSESLRLELERKYSQAGSKGRQRNRNEKQKGASSNNFQQLLKQRQNLPAYKMREKLLSTIHKNRVTVVSGDTGCGKTTQVPQLVLDDLILNNRGAEANIIVTQPRRISAIGVSERIASERCEKLGQTVGYSIRLESKRSKKTRLLLCTTGILLRRLQCDPDLASVSHVFVDEVHERDLNTDFLLIILKDLLVRRKSLKLVLMSATLNAERFSEFFGGCPTVSIPGRAQPVQEFRLEDALQVTNHLVLQGSDNAKKNSPHGNDNNNDRLSKSALKKLYPNYDKNVIDSLAVVDEAVTNYELIAELLQYICLNLEDGAILVFLSGMKEISTCMEALTKIPFFQSAENAVIYPLHSSLSSKEQTAIFNKPPAGKRKIVLATNIAETSITIDDVVFVVDSGRVKENRYDDLNKMPTLMECWASKAATKQRRGRAGRVKPGFCWHLYSSHTHDRILDDYQLPEMLRVGLEDLVLQILVLDLGEPALFLLKAVDPPTNLAIKNALQLLESLGAAECEWHEDEEEDDNKSGAQVSTALTALGYHLATLPVQPRIGKLLIYGALFGCFEDILTIGAAMTSRSPFVSSFDNRDAADEAKRSFASDDHIAVMLAFNKWNELKKRDIRQAKAFLRDNHLSFMGLNNIVNLKRQLQKYMQDIGFVSVSPTQSKRSSNSQNEDKDLYLVRAVVAAGLYPNIVISPKNIPGGKTAGEVALRSQQVNEIYLHPATIAFAAKELDSRYGCYHEIVKTSKVYIRDYTAVSKFAILLFGGSLKVFQTHGVASVDEWLKFRVDAKPATLVKYLRSSMEALLLEKIMDPEVAVAQTTKGMAVIDAVTALLKMEGRK